MTDRLFDLIDPLPQQLNLYAEDFGYLFAAYCKLRSELETVQAKTSVPQDDTLVLDKVEHRGRIGLLIADAEGDIVAINQAFNEIMGYRDGAVIGRSLDSLSERITAPGDGEHPVFDRDAWGGEISLRCINGEVRHLWMQISALRSLGYSGLCRAVLFLDIPDAETLASLGYAGANLDPLTGLPNRSICLDRLQLLISQSRRHHVLLGVLYIDIDGFKEVNDSYGHAAGDRLLLEITWRILSVVRGSDTVARLGGDEFVVIASSLMHKNDLPTIAAKINALLAKPFNIDGHELCIGASIGIAIHPEHGETAATLLRHADQAMYQSKARGRNNYRIFDEELRRKNTDLVLMEAGLRGALARRQLTIHYQPIVACNGTEPVAVEALLRWNWEGNGPVAPDRFIPLAEKTGQIASLEEWVLRQVLVQLLEWDKLGLPPLHLAINRGSRHWGTQEQAEKLLSALGEHHIDPTRIRLEIPEKRLMEMPRAGLEALACLGARGIGITVDHFGTSLSSARRIRGLPVNRIKIDRTFILEANANADARAIVSASVAMAKALHLEIGAVGIEDIHQRRFIEELGCDEWQGNLYGAPMTPAMIAARWQATASDPAGGERPAAPPENPPPES